VLRTFFCNKKLTNLDRRVLYDAEIVAGSPLKFEKYPQEIFFREKAPCKNEPRSNGHFKRGTPSKSSRQQFLMKSGARDGRSPRT